MALILGPYRLSDTFQAQEFWGRNQNQKFSAWVQEHCTGQGHCRVSTPNPAPGPRCSSVISTRSSLSLKSGCCAFEHKCRAGSWPQKSEILPKIEFSSVAHKKLMHLPNMDRVAHLLPGIPALIAASNPHNYHRPYSSREALGSYCSFYGGELMAILKQS